MTPHVRRLQLGKLCVALSGISAQDLIAQSLALLPEFPFAELRLDALPDPLSTLSALRTHIADHPSLTLVATCRRIASGGRFAGTPEAEFKVLLEAAQGGFALVDLAIESADSLPRDAVSQLRSAGAAVILSWHDFERTGDLEAVMERMRAFAPDICKIVPTATTLRDNLPLLQLIKNGVSDSTIVCIAMGEAGVISRILGLRAGSAFTFAAASLAGATAPGQIDAHTLRELYRIESISEKTRIFGVAGSPLRSSLSPCMLNTAFGQVNADAVYLPLLTADAEELFRVARELPLAGFSVTMPLKQAVLSFLRHVDPLAARIGAVNTVRHEPDGAFSGFNTDAAGIVVPLERRLSLQGARVLVLGAGGAARAAVFACMDRGAEVFILNRTQETAKKLANEAQAHAISREELTGLPPFDVVINATPAGMRGNAAALPLPIEELRTKLIFDLVYNPLQTPLLLAARARGIETIAGVEMFVQQGARQFELWIDKPAPVHAMRRVVEQALLR